MNKYKIINLIIFLSGFFLVDFLPFLKNDLKAEDLYVNNFNDDQIQNKKKNKVLNYKTNFKLSNNQKVLDYLVNGFNKYNFKFLELIASNHPNKDVDYNYSMESDIQYTKDTKIFAEGNVLIYLPQGIFRADLVIYDEVNETFEAKGNVSFVSGEQYIEAKSLFFNFKEKIGYLMNAYGLLDTNKLGDDFKLKLNKNSDNLEALNNKKIDNLKYKNKGNIGLVNDFEDNRSFNNKDIDFDVPTINRWRFKSEKIDFKNESLFSKNIYFTNDPFNSPQFILQSKNFKGEIKDQKLNVISKNTWVILEDKIKFPIGRRRIISTDNDSITRWGIGADFSEKDGYFIYRGINPKKVFKNFNLKLQPYFLAQRAIKGSSKSFRKKDSSILSSKVKTDTKFLDYFALDADLYRDFNLWKFNYGIKLNSLNTERISESFRSNLSFSRRFILKNNNLRNTENYFDIEFYSKFREKITKEMGREEEIYFANGFNLSNLKKWQLDKNNISFALIYDFGEYTAEKKKVSSFDTLSRQVFLARFDHKIPLLEVKSLATNIDETYKYSPKVIEKGIYWSTNIQYGHFFYSDKSSQNALIFATGPDMTFGDLKKKYFDYTNIAIKGTYPIKSGESPFVFDDISQDPTINLKLEQQIIGPLIFSYETELNLNEGEFNRPNYALDIKRRAYSLGAFYNSASESLGIRFNIFNFGYAGRSSKF